MVSFTPVLIPSPCTLLVLVARVYALPLPTLSMMISLFCLHCPVNPVLQLYCTEERSQLKLPGEALLTPAQVLPRLRHPLRGRNRTVNLPKQFFSARDHRFSGCYFFYTYQTTSPPQCSLSPRSSPHHGFEAYTVLFQSNRGTQPCLFYLHDSNATTPIWSEKETKPGTGEETN